MNPPPPPKSARSPLRLAMIITSALLGGWVVLWLSGVFDAVGPKVAGLVLGADVLTVGVIWTVLLRRDLSRRR